ncbi:MAG: family 1 encapsulin nanocompartment shell protein, partial [Thermoanaerobaculia bacterium]|nr:family 1 encapsulin nanocompartment shell protein [Thermoanaerobaculia bacterium]
MDLLKRELAPIVPKAWELIDEEARHVLNLHLGGRKLVDFDGPHGWRYGAVNLGTLDLLDDGPEDEVHLGLREVLPLGEVRIPIRLDIMDLDAVARGNHDPDLEPVVEAAEKISRLEDGAIFDGSEELGIEGIIGSSSHEPFALPEDPIQYPRAVVEASEILLKSGIDGPYGLALGPEAYNQLAQAADD